MINIRFSDIRLIRRGANSPDSLCEIYDGLILVLIVRGADADNLALRIEARPEIVANDIVIEEKCLTEDGEVMLVLTGRQARELTGLIRLALQVCALWPQAADRSPVHRII
jgi:hypothetical protein